MYKECREYLASKLIEAGITKKIHLNQKTLDADNESHKGAVIAEADEFERNGEKVKYTDGSGRTHKRTKRINRKITFIVTIGEYTYEATEQIFETFLRSLDNGIYIEDNYTPITIMPAFWYDEEDKIIRSKVAVVCKISFSGGIYKDTPIMHIGLNIETPEMARKE